MRALYYKILKLKLADRSQRKTKSIMAKIKSLLDRIDEVRINSVTDKDYKEFWGESVEEHVDQLMEFAREFDAQIESSVE